MMDTTQEIILVGAPVNLNAQERLGLASCEPPPGSIQVDCDSCHEPMWLGPKQQEKRASVDHSKCLCFMCGAKAVRAGGCEVRSLDGVGGKYTMKDGTWTSSN